jgi:UDP-GlcNAc3NAcA epimerase
MKKIFTVIGARPQFIKAAIVSHVINTQYKDSVQEIIVHTGQHYDANMSDIFFDQMNIPKPLYRLDIGARSHGAMTGEMLIELEKLMIEEKPDVVMVYGDTNSTLAASIAASKLHIPIAHIEAGMRSYDKKIPEEVNRVLTDHVSSYFFCASYVSAQNLVKEGLNDNIHVVGDVMYDLILFYKDKAAPSAKIQELPKDFFLATCHRQENTDNLDNLIAIFDALRELSRDTPVIMPLHPRTKNYIFLNKINTDGITIIDPVGYFDMLYLLGHAKVVLTDSGGLQKEAYYHDKPVVIMRDCTEWVELVDNNIAQLTGANKAKIVASAMELQGIKTFPKNIYGDGNAAQKIIRALISRSNNIQLAIS